MWNFWAVLEASPVGGWKWWFHPPVDVALREFFSWFGDARNFQISIPGWRYAIVPWILWVHPRKLTAGTPKWRFGRWFSSSMGWFLGSMIIFGGVCSEKQMIETKNEIYSSETWPIFQLHVLVSPLKNLRNWWSCLVAMSFTRAAWRNGFLGWFWTTEDGEGFVGGWWFLRCPFWNYSLQTFPQPVVHDPSHGVFWD